MTQPVNPDSVKVTGTLKFLFENDNYGFLLGEGDGKDVFFHLDDMKDTKLTKEQLLGSKDNYMIRFAYNKLAYFGRYGLSMKAINIELVEIIPLHPEF
jgi:hypothetical protein